MTRRIERLSDAIGNLEIDAILIVNEINVRYLTGFTGDSSFLVVRPDGVATILSDGRYETQLSQQCPSIKSVIRPPGQKMDELLAEFVSDQDWRRMGFEADHVRVSTFQRWRESLAELGFVETTEIVENLRAIKDESEIATIRRSIAIAEEAYLDVTGKLSSTMTENDVFYALEAAMRRHGAEGVSFHPIVGAEPSGALPHYRPGGIPLGECRSLLIDWGAKVDGYCSDLTRTLHRREVRSSTSDRFEAAYNAVLEAQLAAIATIADGVATVDVDAAARNILVKAGLGDAFKHGLGHGFGLEIHEEPRMGPSSTPKLQAGMVVTVEPGVYFEGEFGIRIEDDVLVTADGCEVLSRLPKGLDDCPLVM